MLTRLQNQPVKPDSAALRAAGVSMRVFQRIQSWRSGPQPRPRQAFSRGLVLACAVTMMACGGDGGNGGAPTPPPSGGGGGGGTDGPVAATITITASGASPRNVTIPVGSRVTFVNNDNRVHDMSSDPHPVHTDCPQINLVGALSAGANRSTGNLSTPRVCGFHDHNLPDEASLRGTITIQ